MHSTNIFPCAKRSTFSLTTAQEAKKKVQMATPFPLLSSPLHLLPPITPTLTPFLCFTTDGLSSVAEHTTTMWSCTLSSSFASTPLSICHFQLPSSSCLFLWVPLMLHPSHCSWSRRGVSSNNIFGGKNESPNFMLELSKLKYYKLIVKLWGFIIRGSNLNYI